jgi:hypothetical protein
MTCISCSVNHKDKIGSSSKFFAKVGINTGIRNRILGSGKIRPNESVYRNIYSSLSSISNIRSKENMNFGLREELSESIEGNINAYSKVRFGIKQRLISNTNIKTKKTDKFTGKPISFAPTEKLYPIDDISFKSKKTGNNVPFYYVFSFGNGQISLPANIVYSSVDEGVFVGNYTQNNKSGSLVSDDSNTMTFISNMLNDGDVEFKFEVTTPISVAKLSYFAIRLSSPFDNYTTRKAQKYTLYDIYLQDPNGKTIIQYDDIYIQGDNNFTTYISSPKINNLLLPTWDSNYPSMEESDGYVLKFSLSFDCNSFPFNEKFDTSYEQTCIKDYQNVQDNTSLTNILISAIEIGNSGGVGVLRDNYLNLNTQVTNVPNRLERTILPNKILSYDFNNGIYPNSVSIWQSEYGTYDNTTSSGCERLTSSIANSISTDYIKLVQSSLHPDSGKLVLRFDTKPRNFNLDKYINGGFDFGSRNIDRATLINYTYDDNYFDVDELELKIIARKSTGTPDFTFDVVGYSDDRLLNVTSKIGGFLQNNQTLVNNSPTVPDISGFTTYANSISSNALSDSDSYYQRDISLKGDHYIISQSPVVNSTAFKEYTIPLKIYQDPNKLGLEKYSISSLFENLYIDISPLPSGTIITNINMVIKYRPSSAFYMHTLGGPVSVEAKRKSITLMPASSGTINSNIHLSGILTGYKTPPYIHSNYSRRWRGITGDVLSGGDFAYSSFDFSFNHRQATHPFLSHYIDFTNVNGNNIYSQKNTLVAQTATNINVLSNFGWRYSSNGLFGGDAQTPYTSLNWMNSYFPFDYERVIDSFDRAARVSDANELEASILNSTSLSNGFALFFRFTPDFVNSSADLENGLILSCENDSESAFHLTYYEGNLQLVIYDANDDSEFIQDTISLYDYQFPLPVLITYNDDGTNKYKLYTDNELNSNFSNLRCTSNSINNRSLTNQKVRFGFSNTLPINSLPFFIHEIGVSSGTCNIKQSNPNRFLNQISANDLFQSYKALYSNINNDISLWTLGAFKTCPFSYAFNSYTKRNGKDFLVFNLNHHGSGYEQITDLTLPSNINLSGVSYHSQIENDFLRFDLANVPYVDQDRFYSISPRISKGLPSGYLFNKDAICVESIIEHETDSNISWPDNALGPKLIVSLYTDTKNSQDRPSKDFGLVLRDTHYLEPSGCIRKIISEFTYNNLFDESEPWSKFDKESYLEEFETKYKLLDINSMFLQYDLVYPSGSKFSSSIILHSSNVRLKDSVYFGSGVNNISPLCMTTSGTKYQDEILKLNTFCNTFEVNSSTFSLATSGATFHSSGTLGLIIDRTTNWKFGGETDMNLFVRGIGVISLFNGNFGSDLFGTSNLYLPFHIKGERIGEQFAPLYLLSDSDPYSSITLYTHIPDPVLSSSLNFTTLASSKFIDYFPSASTALFVGGYKDRLLDSVENTMSFYTKCIESSGTLISDSLNLFALNYPLSPALRDKSVTIEWNSDNTGSEITVLDNQYSSLNANDNIRGVELTCYGNCNDETKCTEAVVNIHGIQWYYPEICVDGGIFRAKTTYTNLENNVSFSGVDGYDPMPYSGHFYGIRKYTGLAPRFPYNVTITGKTGLTQSIEIPSEILEVEYNKLENDSVMNYDGIRLTANSEYRDSGNEFGKSVASKNDLLAIGSPKIDLEYVEDDQTYTLQEAGAVLLYRRSPRPSGSWPQNEFKSNWYLEEFLTLPSGMLKDYGRIEEISNLSFPENLKPYQTRWVVGQDGRQFGHSVDISVNDNKKSLGENSKEIVVVGGTSARWNREFDDTEPSGISVGLILFTDEFTPRVPRPTRSNRFNTVGYEDVLEAIKDKDLVFNYFSQPRIKFDVKLIICRPFADDSEIIPIDYNSSDKPDFITLKTISRNKFPRTQEQTDKILSGIKDAFFTAFPYDTNKIHNNIPPILGIYVDSSQSLTSRALEPALSQFKKFYKEYSYASGLRDFYGVQDSGIIVDDINNQDAPEDWVEMSTMILSQVLDTGNLVSNNRVRFLTNNIGTFNSNLANFNVPPESGGKVYIFEKESGNWNLIQEIKSPNVTYSHPDRFGHSVSISDNGEVVAIGSPYINQAVTIYELKEDQKDILYSQVYNWVLSKYPEKYKDAILEFENSSQRIESLQLLYLRLDKEHKFECRLDNNIQEYQIVHTFDYSNMQPKGSWTFIPENFAPTSRLGYSVDVNEDGSIVVAGSPTDSMNLYNDADVYHVDGNSNGASFRAYYSSSGDQGVVNEIIKPSWSSTVNAGSAHVFESRKYYPHNRAIEYGKFGNLHEIISNNTTDSGHFNYLSSIFSNKNFVKTGFTETKIPRDAGLVFIITPKEDALSDEIFDNIVNWLSLGDRNLVLVGNDPIWEASGIYKQSNDIINKLLERLNSRMRILPARNRYESLPSGYTSFNNILPSLIPQGSTETYVSRLPVRGSGVGDIRIYYPGYDESMPCALVTLCDPEADAVQIQTRCEMPLRHYGDLRAQWNDFCCKPTPRGFVPIFYKKNWPFIFGSYAPDCGDNVSTNSPTKNQEPIPLLVAGEKVIEEIIYPAVPAKYIEENILQEVEVGTLYFNFGEPSEENPDLVFAWDSENSIYTNLNTNITNKVSNNLFFKPESGGVLQASATPTSLINTHDSLVLRSDRRYFAMEQEFDDKKSKIIVISNIQSESQDKLYGSFLDQNVKFYMNLVSRTPNDIGASKIAQLGAWTGRTSFSNAYSESIIRTILRNDNQVLENVDTSFSNISRPSLDNTFDVAWVANINSQPSAQELEDLKSWLRYGNKKLIITCDTNIESLKHAELLSQNLGVNIGPLFLSYENRYVPVSSSSITIDSNHPVAGGANGNFLEEYVAGLSFYALEKREKNVPLAYDPLEVYEAAQSQSTTQYWNMSPGIASITVPVQAGSGYRIFITTSSDNFTEVAPLNIDISHVNNWPNLPFPNATHTMYLKEINANFELDVVKTFESSLGSIKCAGSDTKIIDIQVASGVSEIDIYISSELLRFSDDQTFVPRTVKLVGISGINIPINQTTAIDKILIPTNQFRTVKVEDEKPEQRVNIDVIRPVSTNNTKYCTQQCLSLGNQLIDDGPVVAAQELEVMSSFDAGFARSRITLLSDSSILQGRYVSEPDGSIPINTLRFIQSLYPNTVFNINSDGRQFNIYNKIVSPERGSPAKYHIYSQLDGINEYFGGEGSSNYDLLNEKESQYLFDSVVRPDVPWKNESKEEKIQEIKNQFISGFLSNQILHAATARFSGIIDGTMYSDATIGGGLPQLLKDKGYDYLDLDKLPSGYLGDLFGYSVCVRGDKVFVGSPFSAFPSENKNIWSSGWSSGVSLHLGNDGGGGAAYIYAKTSGNKWQCDQKIRPKSLMGELSGINSTSDHFGHSIVCTNDVLAIGSPNHDYNNYIDIIDSGAFVRKSFSDQFYITLRSSYDLGDSGTRSEYSDNPTKNAGAVYVYENKMTDWENKKQSWVFIEKLLSKSLSPSGERFGSHIYLSRPRRSDADYTIFAGCNFASGNDMNNIGAAYTKDIMLRAQSPSIPDPNSWISAKVFGYRDEEKEPTVHLAFNNGGFNNKRFFANGVVRTNDEGVIFIEVSGQDLSKKGFISHRPYIESVLGYYKYGKLLEDSLNLQISATNVPSILEIPLFIDVENSAPVYNTMGLYSNAVIGISSSSGLCLYAYCPSGITISDSIGLHSSGAYQFTGTFNLAVRGK